MKQIKFLTVAVLFMMLISLFSCSNKEKVEIIKEFSTSIEAAEECRLQNIQFIPNGYTEKAYRTIYSVVYETEYVQNEKNAILRIVSKEFNTTNLSGYTDTSLFEVYSFDDNDYEILHREGVFACEFETVFGDKLCNVSYVMKGCDIKEFKDNIKQLIIYFAE